MNSHKEIVLAKYPTANIMKGRNNTFLLYPCRDYKFTIIVISRISEEDCWKQAANRIRSES